MPGTRNPGAKASAVCGAAGGAAARGDGGGGGAAGRGPWFFFYPGGLDGGWVGYVLGCMEADIVVMLRRPKLWLALLSLF